MKVNDVISRTALDAAGNDPHFCILRVAISSSMKRYGRASKETSSDMMSKQLQLTGGCEH
jgi:hypothetical protein